MTNDELMDKRRAAKARYCKDYRARVKAGVLRRTYTFKARKKADPQRSAKYYAANRERLLEYKRQMNRMKGILSWEERRAAGLVQTKAERLERKREAAKLSRQIDGERVRELTNIRNKKAKANGHRRNRRSDRKRDLATMAAYHYLRSLGVIEGWKKGEPLRAFQARRRAAYYYARQIGLLSELLPEDTS